MSPPEIALLAVIPATMCLAWLLVWLSNWARRKTLPPPKIGRVAFDFSPEALERYDELVTKTGASNRAELLRWALQTYEACIVYVMDEGEPVDLTAVPRREVVPKKPHLWLVKSPDDD